MAFPQIGLEAIFKNAAFNQAVKSYNASLADMSAYTDSTATGIGAKFLSIGPVVTKALAVVGAAGVAAVGAIGAAAWKAANDLDDAYDTIAIGTGAVGAELAGLEQGFKSVFANVPDSAEAVAGTLTELNRRLGLTGTELQDTTEQIVTMSRLLKTDASQSAALFTRVMGDWSVSNEDAAKTLDMVFKASQETGVGVDDLMSKIVQYGSPMRLMGFTIEDSIALLSKWEQEGVNTELVLSSLRIAAGKFAKEGKPLRESLMATFESIQSNTDASAALALGMEVFGARAGPDMVAAIREGRFSIDELTASLIDSEGAIMAASDATEDWPEKWARIKNKITVALEPIGMKLMDIAGVLLDRLAPAAEFVGDVISNLFGGELGDVFDDWGERIGSTYPWLRGVFDWLSNIASVVQGQVIPAFQQMFSGDLRGGLEALFGPEVAGRIMDITAAIQDIGKAIGQFVSEHAEGLKAALIAIGAVLGTLAIASAIASIGSAIAALANPITAVIAVIGLLAMAWEEDWGGIQEKTRAVIDFLTPYIQAALDWIRQFWADNGEQIIATVTGMWEWIKGAFTDAVAWIGQAIQDIGAWLRSMVDWTHQAGEETSSAFATALDKIKAVVQVGLDIIRGFWEAHGEAIMRVLSNTWDTIKTIVETAITVVRDIIQAVTAAIHGDWYTFGASLRDIVDTIWAAIKTIFKNNLDSIVTILRETVMAIITAVKSVDWLALGKSIVQGIIDGIKSLIEGWKGLIKGLAQNIVDGFKSIDWGAVGRGIINGIKDGITKGIDSIKQAARKAAEAALNAAKGFLGISSPSKLAAEDIGQPFAQGIGLGIREAMKTLSSVELPNLLGELASSPVQRMVNMPAQVGNVTNSRSYSLVINTSAPYEPILADYATLEALA